jgi:hypothetical protein
MTKEKRLYVVTVSHSAYAWAESSEDAEDFAEEIVRVEDYTEVSRSRNERQRTGMEAQRPCLITTALVTFPCVMY